MALSPRPFTIGRRRPVEFFNRFVRCSRDRRRPSSRKRDVVLCTALRQNRVFHGDRRHNVIGGPLKFPRE